MLWIEQIDAPKIRRELKMHFHRMRIIEAVAHITATPKWKAQNACVLLVTKSTQGEKLGSIVTGGTAFNEAVRDLICTKEEFEACVSDLSNHAGEEAFKNYLEYLKTRNRSITNTETERTPQEQHMCNMLIRKMRGLPIEVKQNEDCYLQDTGYILHISNEYRVPVVKLNIPWEVLREDIICAAMDEDGYIYFYTEKPVLSVSSQNHWFWQQALGDTYSAESLEINTEGIDWKESLTFRPTKVNL